MKIYIHAFSSVKTIFGFSKKEMAVKDRSKVDDILHLLFDQYNDLIRMKGTLLFAVNEEYCDKKTELKEGDILAIFPPVSGG